MERPKVLWLDEGLYTLRRAAHICRVSVQRLSYWVRSGLISPHIHASPPRIPPILSYNDLLAVNAIRRFRDQSLPLQRIRIAVKYISKELEQGERWHELKLVTDGDKLVTVVPVSESIWEWGELVDAARYGQKFFEVAFADLVNDLYADRELIESPRLRQLIDINPRVQAGAPTIRGTRITTSVIAALSKRGVTSEEIASFYDGVSQDAVEAALQYEKVLVGHQG